MSHRLPVFTKVSVVTALDMERLLRYLSPGLGGQTGLLCEKGKSRAIRGSRLGKQAGVRAHLNPRCVLDSTVSSRVFLSETDSM